jgi:hypothetical protein
MENTAQRFYVMIQFMIELFGNISETYSSKHPQMSVEN